MGVEADGSSHIGSAVVLSAEDNEMLEMNRGDGGVGEGRFPYPLPLKNKLADLE